MKIKRTENAFRNTFFGGLSKIYQMIIPFCMRTIMLYTLGVNYLGLNSLFSSILQVLNLAELGVGSAMVFSMYKPIAEDDSPTICALMRLYRQYYRIIGVVIGGAGLLLLPFLPSLIKSDLPSDVNLYVLYLLNLASTVATYWMFAYKNALVIAHQRTDIQSKVALALTTVQYALQIMALTVFQSYYLYLIILLLTQIGKNVATAVIVNKMYPKYKPEGELPVERKKNINQRIRDLFTQKISSTILSSVDTVVISAFLGLTTLAVYQNYYYVISSVMGIIAVIFDACSAGVGNSLETETTEKNYQDLRKLTFLLGWLLAVTSCGLVCLYQHFMLMWVGESLLLEFSLVILFVWLFYLTTIGRLFDMFKDAAGIWHQDRWRPLCAAIFNLILNLILVQYIGLYGIILSTLISMIFISYPWELHNLFSNVYKKGLASYVGFLLKNIVITIIISIVGYGICSFIPGIGIFSFVGKGLIALFVSNTILYFAFRNTEEFAQAKQLIMPIMKKLRKK